LAFFDFESLPKRDETHSIVKKYSSKMDDYSSQRLF
jgi:hypothetical protein